MNNSNIVIDTIADDLKIMSYPGESIDVFSSRVIYSASRLWIDAMCMNDGGNGSHGIAKAALTRKITNWINDCKPIWPQSGQWFCLGESKKGIPTLYNRLISIGELSENSQDHYLSAHLPFQISLPFDYCLICGCIDRISNDIVDGIESKNLITTGLATLKPGVMPEIIIKDMRWWEEQSTSMTWSDLNNFGEIEYINPYSKHWNIKQKDVWINKPIWIDDLTVARIVFNDAWATKYLLIKRHNMKSWGSIIDINKVYCLYFYMRRIVNNPICAKSKRLDNCHSRLFIPTINSFPSPQNYLVDILSWPVRNILDNTQRIIRSEALPLVAMLLKSCNVYLKE